MRRLTKSDHAQCGRAGGVARTHQIDAGCHARAVRAQAVPGDRVAQLVRAPLPAGRHAVAWDGLRSDGSRAAPGIYLVRARHPAGSATLRVIALR